MLDILKKVFSSEGSEKDPVCGMTVDSKTALHTTHEGKQYYFCSEDCKNKFTAKPEESITHKNHGGCTCC